MKLVIAAVVICGALACEYSSFDDFASKYGKSYTDDEVDVRRTNWEMAKAEIAAHNARVSSWTAGLNEFSDMSWEEFQQRQLMAPQDCSATHASTGWVPPQGASIPSSIDWRAKGAVNAIKSQGQCGSCWTFSTSGCLESHHYLKTGKMVNISEQQLVDCAGRFNNHGCNGGLPSQAFEYIRYNGGIDSESAYAYTAKTGTKCLYDGKPVATVSDVHNITTNDEDELTQAVGTTGPVSIAYQVASDFRLYKNGTYDGNCSTSPADVNHAVVAVGYGHDASASLDYFIVRNSWGTSWGMAGDFQIHRGVNKCGLADCASFPVV